MHASLLLYVTKLMPQPVKMKLFNIEIHIICRIHKAIYYRYALLDPCFPNVNDMFTLINTYINLILFLNLYDFVINLICLI